MSSHGRERREKGGAFAARLLLAAVALAVSTGCLRMTPDVMNPDAPAHVGYTAGRTDSYGTSTADGVVYSLDGKGPLLPDDAAPDREHRYPTGWLKSGLAPRFRPVPMTQTVHKPKGGTGKNKSRKKSKKSKKRR